jgi:nucleotide-binding universal stress UspA family protein
MNTTDTLSATAPPARTVVVGVDFTEESDFVVREAARLASGGELHAVHVLEAGAARTDDALDRATEALAEVPQRLRRYLAERGVTRAYVHVRVPDGGGVAGALQQLAVDVDADLIVVGTHGVSVVLRVLGSSVAETLVRTAHCPVEVARAKDYAALQRTPQIEPPCPACVQARRESGGTVWWCAEHQRSTRARARHYGLSNTMSDPFYDSNVVPTGVKMI